MDFTVLQESIAYIFKCCNVILAGMVLLKFGMDVLPQYSGIMIV
jgi:repressor of nif and glnA expression